MNAVLKPTENLPALTIPQLPALPLRSSLSLIAHELVQDATDLEVDGDQTFQLGAEIVQRANGQLKDFEEKRLAHTRPLDAYKKTVIDHYAEPVADLESAIRIGKSKMLQYTEQQHRIREEAERKAREAAEIERKKQEAIAAEQARQAREKERQAEIARQAEEDARRRGDQAAADKAAQEAATLKAHAETQAATAQEIQTASEIITRPNVEIAAPKVAGISTSYAYSAEVTNLKALLQAIIDGKESEALIDLATVNKAVSARARLEKEAFRMPGCQLIKTPKMTAGRA